MGRPRKAEPNRTKTDRRGTREKLVRSASRRFATQGVVATSIADITSGAGVSVGTFYRYFRDKDELYGTLVVQQIGAFIDSIRTLLDQDEARSVFERVDVIRQVFRCTFESHSAQPDVFLLWFREGAGTSPAVVEDLHGLTLELEQLLCEVLDRSMSVGGSLDETTRRIIARSMIGTANAMAHSMIVDGKPGLAEAIEVCTQLVIGGLLGFSPPERYRLLIELYRQETETRRLRASGATTASDSTE